MYDHFYVIEELQKQRERELMKLVAETKMINNRPFICYVPILKQNNQCNCY
ncbi:hypothetical protein ACFSO7_16955 [Bacillus sp. CGMCC 1.16607]|uniref:hypothetical protein n=1 Tax=Bacillus sp. CGMCC 1.16607 TaxID=3351842 RepID=UPI00363AE3D0